MYTIKDIYTIFRRCQSRSMSRPYRIPKDFDKWFIEKANKNTQESLEKITLYFNTKWQNINPERYFDCGFKLWKTFSYHQFFNPKLLTFYIEQDKMIKRNVMNVKNSMVKSLKHVITNYSDVFTYCNTNYGAISQPIKDFLDNKIDKYFVSYLIYKGFIKLRDNERAMLSVITSNYHDIINEIKKVGDEFMSLFESKVIRDKNKLWTVDTDVTGKPVSGGSHMIYDKKFPDDIQKKYVDSNLNE